MDITKIFKPLDVKKLYQHGRDFESQLNQNNKLVKAASFSSPQLRANTYRAPTVSLMLDPFIDEIFNEVIDATVTHWPNIQLNPQILQSVAAGASITADNGITGSDQALTPSNKAYVRDFEYNDILTLTFDGDNEAGLDAVIAIDLQNSDIRTGFQGDVGWVSSSLSLQASNLITSASLTGSVDPLTTKAALESGSVNMSVHMKKLREQGGLDVVCGYGFYDAEFIRRRDEAGAGGTVQPLDPDGKLRYRRMELKPHQYMDEKYIFFTPSSNLGIATIEGNNTSHKFFDARTGQGGTLQVTVHRRQAYGFRDVNILYLYNVADLNL